MKHQNETIELIELCKKGNSQAQYHIYKLYSKAMYSTSLRIVGTREDAEDVVQEAFLDGFTKISMFRGESTFGAWLKSIVINKSIAKIRGFRATFEEIDSSICLEEDDDDFETTEHTVSLIKKLIADLSSGYRLVLSLYLFEGYDHKEIAEIMGVSEVTSRTQYIRAKQKLLNLYRSQQ